MNSQGQVVRARTLDGRDVVGIVISGENGEGLVVVASEFSILGGRPMWAHEDRATITEVIGPSADGNTDSTVTDEIVTPPSRDVEGE